jgi:hypothetical protein
MGQAQPGQPMPQTGVGVPGHPMPQTGALPMQPMPQTGALPMPGGGAPPAAAGVSDDQIRQYYNQYLGRDPSPQEIQNWKATGKSSAAIQQAIQGSPEAHQRTTAQQGGAGGRGAAGGGGGIGGGGGVSVSGPTTDTTSQTPGEYGTFAVAAKNLFGQAGMTTFPGGSAPWGEQFLSDEALWGQAIGGGKAGGATDPFAQDWTKGGGMTGFAFDPSVSGSDIQKVLGFAETWAALTGWKYFPPAQVIQILAKQTDINQQSAYDQFWQQIPQDIQGKIPGAKFGLNPTDYLKTSNQFQTAYAGYTGTYDLPQSVIDQMLAKNRGQVDITAFEQWVRSDPGTLAKAPWMNAGLNYQAWKNYQQDPGNIQAAKARFGEGGATRENFLTNLLHPEIGVAAKGGPVTPQQRGAKSATPTGFQSEVR